MIYNECYRKSDDDENYEDVFLDAKETLPDSFTRLKEMLDDDESNKTINASLLVSKIEVLLAIFKFSIVHSLTNAANDDLCKIINSFFDSRIIPDTRYLLDKLFYPGENLHYHAVCPDCKTYRGKFDKSKRTIYCQICEKHVNLKDPTYRDFFITFDIHNKFQRLIETNNEHYSKVIAEREAFCYRI